MLLLSTDKARPFLLVFLLLSGSACFLSGKAQSSYWKAMDAASIPLNSERVNGIAHPAYYQLDTTAILTLLRTAPPEWSDAGSRQPSSVVIHLPTPDGRQQRFRCYASPIAEEALCRRYGLLTYVAQGIDEPAATARLGWTASRGFHAIVRSPSGVYSVDAALPAQNMSYYVVYFHHERQVQVPMACMSNQLPATYRLDDLEADTRHGAQLVAGNRLRTYRLALAATGEYTAYHGGTIALALAAMIRTINRVNAIYEQDLAVRLVLVENTDQLIFINPTTDPYTNNNGLAMLSQNQNTIDAIIGDTNYDIGHVFSTGGGGVAELGVVCVSGRKARGVTGLPEPEGDIFDIDYVAHEIGHQFGANHTFNAQAGACLGNRVASAAYEPMSGSTIMAYAGICSPENIQASSDAYFHIHSIREIQNFINNTATCARQLRVNNTAPLVYVADQILTIPHSTPFALRGSATDAQADALTYCWEQYDLEQDGLPPLFRSRAPTPEAVRFFPAMERLLLGINTLPELLPSTDRFMKFRLTVRDNHAGCGGVSFQQVLLNVSSDAGPFRVTYPNEASVVWNEGELVSIQWDVANTNLAPIGCQTVDIYLSRDGGNTFPTSLQIAAAVPNVGSYSFVCPTIKTNEARVMIVANNHVFYAVNEQNFTINADLVTAIEENKKADIAVFPNPSEGVFVVSLPKAYTQARLMLYTADGKQVSSLLAHGQSETVMDVRHLPAGIYVLHVLVADKSYQHRIVKYP